MTVDPIIDADGVSWTFDHEFLASNWTCIWDRGCAGVGTNAEPERQLGCCSQGAELHDDDEIMAISALAATLDPEQFQFHAEAAHGIVAQERNEYDRAQTRRVDGACIFLNRPGFAGGAGCALHHGAVEFDESPMDWKPSVCWQLPVRVDHRVDEHGDPHAHVRRWTKADWGPDGEAMAWCCTETNSGVADAYVGSIPVIQSLADELTGLVGTEVMVQLRDRHAYGS